VAREINNYDNVVLGVGLPATAGALAKALHAPEANLMLEPSPNSGNCATNF
jgi:glutaconate CoA-transferase subunit B